MRCYRPGMPRYVPWHMRTEADATPDVGGAIAAMLAGAGRVGTAQMARAAAQRDAWMVPSQQATATGVSEAAAASHSGAALDDSKSISGRSKDAAGSSSTAAEQELSPAVALMTEIMSDPW